MAVEPFFLPTWSQECYVKSILVTGLLFTIVNFGSQDVFHPWPELAIAGYVSDAWSELVGRGNGV